MFPLCGKDALGILYSYKKKLSAVIMFDLFRIFFFSGSSTFFTIIFFLYEYGMLLLFFFHTIYYSFRSLSLSVKQSKTKNSIVEFILGCLH